MNYTYYRRYQPSKRRSSFKSFFWLVVVLVALLLIVRGCVSVATSLFKDKQDEATLTLNQGTAEVVEWGQSEAQTVADAQLLLVGDTVSTGEDSIVTLTFANGTRVVLDQNSKLNFSSATAESDSVHLVVDLLSGRAFVKQMPEDEMEVTLELHTNVIDLSSVSASYLVSNQPDKQYVYGFDGQATERFVDRAQGDTVIDTAMMEKGKKTVLSDEDEKNLLARQSVTLMVDAGDDLLGDSFVAYNKGDVSAVLPTEETADTTQTTTDEATTTTDEVTTTTELVTDTTPVSSLQIQVTSPGLNTTLQKSAIAIEGSIVAGTADHVTVTWDGNGKPYTLAGFKAGGSTFRYVADASYGNFKAGVNTFTVVAYAADGTVSNTVTVVINAEF